MPVTSMMDCVRDLEKGGHLLRVTEEVDPYLEMAEIQRRAYRQGAPALFFERVKGSAFPALANIFGSEERCAYLFRQTLAATAQAVQIKADPAAFCRRALRAFWRDPAAYFGMCAAGLHALPKRIKPSRAPVLANRTSIDKLPGIVCWPADGGPFITLPQVFSQDPERQGPLHGNLGMYRVQLAGNDYTTNSEIGLHYQIHRGIGIHHGKAIEAGQPLKVSIFVGGPPAHSFAAVMPLPEGLSELLFAGMLAGRRFRYTLLDGYLISADADFCITGTVTAETKPEGPFGDHLGYYSLTHDFPVMRVDRVYHRNDAVWPFTVVGRPPQEDTSFGKLIHRITAPMVPVSLPGVKALHAVDAAGVHPLLLCIGREGYVPYGARRPMELLTQANAVLGFNQCSLAKYLMIVATEDDPELDVNDIEAFFCHLLARADWRTDLHFHTNVTIDTLDYSGTELNCGSKLVIAAAGPVRRRLGEVLPAALSLPAPYGEPAAALKGVLVIQGPAFVSYARAAEQMDLLITGLAAQELDAFPLIVVVDDAAFTARTKENFLWVCFTRSNPARDCYGVAATTTFKHWGCDGSLIIDARIKPGHAPPLIEDPAVSARVDDLCAEGKSLYGVIEPS